MRLSIDSLWKVGRKRGWWKVVRAGDVWVFVVAMGVVGAVYEVQPGAIRGGVARKGIGWLRGEALVEGKDGEKDA